MLVIKGKDVIKWILKIVAVALILFFITKFFIPISKGTDKIINNIEKEKLISCIDDNIPAIKQVNSNNSEEEQREKINPLNIIVNMQLNMISQTKPKEESKNKENNDHCSSNQLQDPFFIMITVGKEIGNRKGIRCHLRISPDSLRHHQPVYISSNSQADGRPSGICNTGQISDSRQSHQKPAAHIRGFCTHCSNERS